MTILEAERRAIVEGLRYTCGHVGDAAELLGIGRTTLYLRLKELMIEPREYMNESA